jgi:hypothetical protein
MFDSTTFSHLDDGYAASSNTYEGTERDVWALSNDRPVAPMELYRPAKYIFTFVIMVLVLTSR